MTCLHNDTKNAFSFSDVSFLSLWIVLLLLFYTQWLSPRWFSLTPRYQFEKDKSLWCLRMLTPIPSRIWIRTWKMGCSLPFPPVLPAHSSPAEFFLIFLCARKAATCQRNRTFLVCQNRCIGLGACFGVCFRVLNLISSMTAYFWKKSLMGGAFIFCDFFHKCQMRTFETNWWLSLSKSSQVFGREEEPRFPLFLMVTKQLLPDISVIEQPHRITCLASLDTSEKVKRRLKWQGWPKFNAIYLRRKL